MFQHIGPKPKGSVQNGLAAAPGIEGGIPGESKEIRRKETEGKERRERSHKSHPAGQVENNNRQLFYQRFPRGNNSETVSKRQYESHS